MPAADVPGFSSYHEGPRFRSDMFRRRLGLVSRAIASWSISRGVYRQADDGVEATGGRSDSAEISTLAVC